MLGLPNERFSMRRLIAVTAALGLGAAALATAGTASAGTASTAAIAAVPVTSSSISWGVCDDEGLTDAGAVCGTLAVPLDYSHPARQEDHRWPCRWSGTPRPTRSTRASCWSTRAARAAPGWACRPSAQYVPNGAGDFYDWIGWDPRGVGSSTPSLSCIPDYNQGPRPNYTPVNRAVEKAWLARSAAYAKACGQNGGALLDHVTTVDSAKDMESIRKAMGQKQMNYFGFSYGTYLGSVYGTLFPNQLRRAVFDSTVDPTRVFYQANLDQDIAFEKNIRIWFALARQVQQRLSPRQHRGQGRNALLQTLADLYKNPAGGVVGGAEWNDIFLYAGYYQQTWLDLGDAFSAWVNNHDLDRIIGEYEGPKGSATTTATRCTWPPSAPTRRGRRATRRSSGTTTGSPRKAPFETWANAWFNGPCLGWPGQARKAAVKVDGSKVKSLLMIDETLDAATPYSGSLEVRKLFPNASLIALPGWHLARQLAVRQRLRGRPDRGLPGRRHAARRASRATGPTRPVQAAAGAGPDRSQRLRAGSGQVGRRRPARHLQRPIARP